MRVLIPKKTVRQILRWTRNSLLAGSASLLGYCCFVAVDAWSFQQEERVQLARQVHARQPVTRQESPRASMLPPAAVKRVVTGDLIGNMEIPRLGVSVIVVEGTGKSTLRRAVGHIRGTGFPGQPGNTAISGHRDTFFRPLRNIQQNDVIELTTGQGEYRYRVISTKIVSPEDVSVLDSSADQILTLVTCYPFYFVGAAPNRFIVRAERVVL